MGKLGVKRIFIQLPDTDTLEPCEMQLQGESGDRGLGLGGVEFWSILCLHWEDGSLA